jgi:hypothetical protein
MADGPSTSPHVQITSDASKRNIEFGKLSMLRKAAEKERCPYVWWKEDTTHIPLIVRKRRGGRRNLCSVNW